MAVLLSEDFSIQQYNTNFNVNDILKVETIKKPLTFAEIGLIRNSIKRWQIFVCNRRLLKKYFNNWKAYNKMATESQNESTIQKIDIFISELHRMKTNRRKCIKSSSETVNAKKRKENTEIKKETVTSECFKNRFKTQKEIILIQKEKLKEQSRIIDDLKLGIIKDELSKSLADTKEDLKQIFVKSPNKLRTKMAASGLKIEDTLVNFILNSSKAPKFLQQMERRALERAKNREIIRERKRLIDAEKQRIFEEAVEQKKRQDEEEKRKNLEAIKEKQRADLERQKMIQANKEKYFENLRKAIWFYKRKLLRRCLHRLQHNVYITQNNILKADRFCETKIKQHALKNWKSYLVAKYKKENEKADKLFKKRMCIKTFQYWKIVRKSIFGNN